MDIHVIIVRGHFKSCVTFSKYAVIQHYMYFIYVNFIILSETKYETVPSVEDSWNVMFSYGLEFPHKHLKHPHKNFTSLKISDQ